jgi:anaphase-promoting complex subunit 3
MTLPNFSVRTSETSFYPPDITFHQVHPPARSQSSAAGPSQLHTSRPLSSADEAGPVAKKLRSTAPQPEMARSSKPLKLTVDEPLKKARARPALKLSNLFSSSGRSSQPPIPSRSTSGTGKSTNHAGALGTGTRRSTRLNSGTTVKQPYGSKVGEDLFS